LSSSLLRTYFFSPHFLSFQVTVIDGPPFLIHITTTSNYVIMLTAFSILQDSCYKHQQTFQIEGHGGVIWITMQSFLKWTWLSTMLFVRQLHRILLQKFQKTCICCCSQEGDEKKQILRYDLYYSLIFLIK